MADNHLKLSFRCTPDEMKLIEQAATKAGCSKSHFVRDIVFQTIHEGGIPATGFPVVLTPELQQKLVRAVLVPNLLLQKKMLDDDQEELWQAASDRAKEIVESKV